MQTADVFNLYFSSFYCDNAVAKVCIDTKVRVKKQS